MKQLHFNFECKEQLREELRLDQEISRGNCKYFQIFSSSMEADQVKEATTVIEELFPDSICIANSSAGNILNAREATVIDVAVNIFEYETSRVEVFHYDFSLYDNMEQVSEAIKKEVVARPWTKAIEFYHTIPKESTSHLCDALADLPPEIQAFGGIVCSSDISSDECFLYSNKGGMTNYGLVCLFFGGEDLFIDSMKISGWKGIGRNFRVTSSQGNILKTLDGMAAYDVYHRYLGIRNDENFFMNALDFPIMYDHNDTTIVRACSASLADGSIRMSANIDEGSVVRLSYGEPLTILDSVREKSFHIREFQPDVMHIFSCAARKTFWKGHTPTLELHALKSICSNSGFFSHGEFLREKGKLNQHNLTLVITSMREGPKKATKAYDPEEEEKAYVSARLPLAARMATFIRETSYELEENNKNLEEMNRQLEVVAKLDTLTGLGNRFAFNDCLDYITEDSNSDQNWTMYMFDVNGLKNVNDTFGHLAGDELIKHAARIIKNVYGTNGHCFRVGGDEFVALVPLTESETDALDQEMEKVLDKHNEKVVYSLSIASGKSGIWDKDGQHKSLAKWKMDTDLSMYRHKAACHKEAELKKDNNVQQMINFLISIVEAKDPYTACHSDRVCAISEFLARKMGMTEPSINLIADAAKLHDIGKVGISDSVLFKTGRLTAEEFEKIKEHSVIGAKILVQSNYTQDVVDIVLHHHERYDGGGYPHRLVGTDIPLGARIIALADSIDAMTSKRVYRDSLPMDKCYQEIKTNIGKMYDPAIGNIALENWNEIISILAKKVNA